MPIRPEKLKALMGQPSDKEAVPLPKAWGVLYAAPNPDGTRKRCDNCFMWVRAEGGRCVIHARSVRVMASMVCGYHVFGAPMKEWVSFPSIDSVQPATSGLGTVGEGTSCNICRYYVVRTAERGDCVAVAGPGGGAQPVQALGCCSRWERG